ncbi:hypothetical protein VNO77_14189 [Canavalia gladiata]|uniref:Uncharacterized protein n=1 Tax=Canavalia gladiata TaxID=3824 RepID=A0AAN9M397_CANGL
MITLAWNKEVELHDLDMAHRLGKEEGSLGEVCDPDVNFWLEMPIGMGEGWPTRQDGTKLSVTVNDDLYALDPSNSFDSAKTKVYDYEGDTWRVVAGDVLIHDFFDSGSPYLLASLLGKHNVITKDTNRNIIVLQSPLMALISNHVYVGEEAFVQEIKSLPLAEKRVPGEKPTDEGTPPIGPHQLHVQLSKINAVCLGGCPLCATNSKAMFDALLFLYTISSTHVGISCYTVLIVGLFGVKQHTLWNHMLKLIMTIKSPIQA